MEISRFTDLGTRYEKWILPDTGWEDWAATVDRFLVHAIRGIAEAYESEPVKWLEINGWLVSGRLIVFPSQDGPSGDRGERVCFELGSDHLEAAMRIEDFEDIFPEIDFPELDEEAVSEAIVSGVWQRVSDCLRSGESGRALSIARQTHKMRIAGYDYEWGEGLHRLTETGEIA